MISSMFKELKEKMEVRMVFCSTELKAAVKCNLYHIFQLNITGLSVISVTVKGDLIEMGTCFKQ